MDTFYNKHAAGEVLEDFAAVRREALSARVQGSIFHLADVDSMHVTETGDHYKNWRLCTPQDEEGVLDEMIVRIQGVISQCNLVPKNAHTCPPRKALYLSQQIEICGLDTATFDDAAAKIPEVVDRFEQHLAGAELRTIPEVVSTSGKIFRASNRVFTAKSDSPTEQDTEFHRGVDPLNVLQKLKGSDLIHAPENMVRYYRRVEESGVISYDDTVPGSFKPGDIVELQVTFVAIKAAMNKVKVTTRLQAVTLLSNEFTKKAEQERAAARAPYAAHRPAVRRRVGHFNEDNEEEHKVKKRRLDAERESEMGEN